MSLRRPTCRAYRTLAFGMARAACARRTRTCLARKAGHARSLAGVPLAASAGAKSGSRLQLPSVALRLVLPRGCGASRRQPRRARSGRDTKAMRARQRPRAANALPTHSVTLEAMMIGHAALAHSRELGTLAGTRCAPAVGEGRALPSDLLGRLLCSATAPISIAVGVLPLGGLHVPELLETPANCG